MSTMNQVTLFAVFAAIMMATSLVIVGALYGIFTPLQMCVGSVVGFSAGGAVLAKLFAL